MVLSVIERILATIDRAIQRSARMVSTLRYRSMFLLVALTVMNVNVGMALPATVSGKIRDSRDAPIPSASVMVFSLARPLLLIPEPVHPDGSFSIKFDATRNAPLRCEISAPGFMSETRNFELSEDMQQSLGTIVLKTAAVLKIREATRIVSGALQEIYLDFFLINAAENDIEVNGIHITGTARGETSCLDFTPALNLDITQLVAGGKITAVSIHDNQTQQTDTVSAKGGAELLPCQQCRLDITVPMLFRLAGHEERKIRIVLPRHVAQKSRECRALEDWAAMGIHVLTANGDISATVR